MLKKIVSVVLCILWMGFIFYNSSRDGTQSNEFSNKVLYKIINEIKGNASDNELLEGPVVINNNMINKDVNGVTINIDTFVKQFELTNPSIFIRKNAHAFEFLVLAILFASVLRSFGMKIRKSIIYVMFFVLFYAVTDEFHQIFIPGRNSNVFDIVVDFIGGLIGILLFIIYYFIVALIKKKLKKS
ncbi:VanZ family protein [Clostridium sp. HCP1S3_B4]|uniref:VanZ family protein n=1 Tax=unclassified Clostridium TaxID=2614128 RepID=UPI002A7E238B|nr:VanZ family protein [Clostridium sp.]